MKIRRAKIVTLLFKNGKSITMRCAYFSRSNSKWRWEARPNLMYPSRFLDWDDTEVVAIAWKFGLWCLSYSDEIPR